MELEEGKEEKRKYSGIGESRGIIKKLKLSIKKLEEEYRNGERLEELEKLEEVFGEQKVVKRN